MAGLFGFRGLFLHSKWSFLVHLYIWAYCRYRHTGHGGWHQEGVEIGPAGGGGIDFGPGGKNFGLQEGARRG